MTSGPEHYRDAERCLEYAKDAEPGSSNERFLIDAAKIHAALANAAATIAAGEVHCGAWEQWSEAFDGVRRGNDGNGT